MPERDDEFYVGYLPRAPRRIAARMKGAVLLVLAAAAATALVLTTGQERFGPGTYEFAVTKKFTGVIVERPYPRLVVERPGRTELNASFSSYLLVTFGKRGAQDLVAGMDATPVTLQGSLVYREGQTMIEVLEGSIEPWAGGASDSLRQRISAAEVHLGQGTWTGEIVDSKCYRGVMKPARWKPHRSCAVRCISGGIPPLFIVQDETAGIIEMLLVAEDGSAVNDRVLDRVAEPLQITGRLIRLGDTLVLRADPESYRRLGE